MKRTPLKRVPFRARRRSRATKTRAILYGAKYSELRYERALLANFTCECGCGRPAPFVSGSDQPLWAGQLAHIGRGAKRSSELSKVRWMLRECHDKFDNRNQKVVPAKPGKDA